MFSVKFFTKLTPPPVFPDGPRRIPNTVVREGGGIGWMLNPVRERCHVLEH